MEELETLNRIARRQYSADFKAQVLSECTQPGVRVADVAASHGLTDTTVHRWIRQARPGPDTVTPNPTPAFVSVALTGSPAPLLSPNSVQLTFEKNGVLAKVQCAVSDCAALLREVLR
jgi:transposase-like protein